MMEPDRTGRQIFMVGRGGQGILLLAKALAELAFRKGMKVITSETHGMAMRGGTVTASLKIGSYMSPLIPAGSADMLIGLEESEAQDHLHMLKPGGVSVVNALRQGPFDFTVDATGRALDMGSPGSVNMIVLGLAASILGFTLPEIRTVIQEISPGKFVSKNIEGVEAGFDSRESKSH